MTPYGFSLALGAAGLATMAVLGLGSHAHPGHGHDGHGGHHDHGGDGSHGHQEPAALRLAAIASPRLWFTLLTGFGAAGLLVRPLVAAGPLRVAAAVLGAVLFEALLARPLWNFAFRFAARPATTLEACVTDEVEVVTGFDREGYGLVAVELDGQVVHILATLRPADRAAGIRVRAGDRVRVEEVDPARNRCVVSAQGS
jgi:translation initiation factor IF-1